MKWDSLDTIPSRCYYMLILLLFKRNLIGVVNILSAKLPMYEDKCTRLELLVRHLQKHNVLFRICTSLFGIGFCFCKTIINLRIYGTGLSIELISGINSFESNIVRKNLFRMCLFFSRLDLNDLRENSDADIVANMDFHDEYIKWCKIPANRVGDFESFRRHLEGIVIKLLDPFKLVSVDTFDKRGARKRF